MSAENIAGLLVAAGLLGHLVLALSAVGALLLFQRVQGVLDADRLAAEEQLPGEGGAVEGAG